MKVFKMFQINFKLDLKILNFKYKLNILAKILGIFFYVLKGLFIYLLLLFLTKEFLWFYGLFQI